MKILLIFTGGTIGSTCRNNVISTSENKPKVILEAYKNKYGINFDYTTEEPYTELSENITGKHLKLLTNCVCKNLRSGFDGIIVTHGTDTIQYSAAALGYAIGLDSIPICIVSANRPFERLDILETARLQQINGQLWIVTDSVPDQQGSDQSRALQNK